MWFSLRLLPCGSGAGPRRERREGEAVGLTYYERVIVTGIQHEHRDRDLESRIAIYERLLDDARREKREADDEIAAQLGMKVDDRWHEGLDR